MSDSLDSQGNSTVFNNPRKLVGNAMEKVSVSDKSFSPQSGFAATDSIIMMVDDELLNIEMTQAFLEDAGYSRFVSTTDSERTIALMRTEQPHVVLLDLSMPKVGGIQILAALREDEQLRHIPVIVLTSNADSPTKLQALGLGATDFLAKPVDPSELALRLRNTLAAAAHRKYLINHDLLTELPNRRSYLVDVYEAIKAATAQGHSCALLHIGVDNLSQLNNAMGRNAGDQLLQRMAKRLSHCVQSAQGGELGPLEWQYPRLYRFDGDEFAVLVPYLDEVQSAAGLITSLLEAASTRLKIGSNEVLVTASLGVAVYPIDGDTPMELARDAGLAMRQARESGNSYEFFTPRLKEVAVSALLVGGDIRRALTFNELSLVYQPKIAVGSGALTGVEATLRWTREGQTVMEGEQIFRLAGTTDLAISLAEWMLAEVARQTAEWLAADWPVVPVGLKFSLKQFTPSQLGELLSLAIIRGAKAKLICLELSGVSGLSTASAVGRMTSKLQKWDFRIALDNFGTTDNSLNDLDGLTIDEIKMAPQFMTGIEDSVQNAAVIRSMLGLARDLRCDLVIQGVETAEQLAVLKKINVAQCQGKLFSDPLSAEEFAVKWWGARKPYTTL